MDDAIRISSLYWPQPPPRENITAAAAAPYIHKIRNGGQRQLRRVVRIQGDFMGPKPGLLCSGVFIAKNWIATAAHCLVYGQNRAKLNAWHQYQIVWADNTGGITGPDVRFLETASPKEHLPSVIQIPDTRYTGYNPNNPELATSGPNDFALLNVDPIYDTELPADPNDGSMMILSLQKGSSVAASSSFWGWGLPDEQIESQGRGPLSTIGTASESG